MQLARPRFAADPRSFGRGRLRDLCAAPLSSTGSLPLSDDLKLFASTFIAGFVFVSVMIA